MQIMMTMTMTPVMIMTRRRIRKRNENQNLGTHKAFIDFENAFDSMNNVKLFAFLGVFFSKIKIIFYLSELSVHCA
jgi:hypothetical protein